MGLAVAMAAQTYLPVTSYIIITLDLPQHDFDTNFGMAGPALTDDLCEDHHHNPLLFSFHEHVVSSKPNQIRKQTVYNSSRMIKYKIEKPQTINVIYFFPDLLD